MQYQKLKANKYLNFALQQGFFGQTNVQAFERDKKSVLFRNGRPKMEQLFERNERERDERWQSTDSHSQLHSKIRKAELKKNQKN
jgi:hypothetical protein